MSAGIDYGMGRTNINRETGIRYGVISCDSVMPEALSDFEGDYGEACCPKCGNAAIEFSAFEGDVETFEEAPGCADYVCELCEYVFDSQDAFSEEAQGFTYEQDGYKLTMGTDGFGVFVLNSPYYTLAAFCSPCAPWEAGSAYHIAALAYLQQHNPLEYACIARLLAPEGFELRQRSEAMFAKAKETGTFPGSETWPADDWRDWPATEGTAI